MTSQALSGVIALRLVSREGSPSLLEVRHTHTQTDPNWITKSTCIVTSNVDRVIINAEAAKAYVITHPFCDGNAN
jgi:hypothetical protein